MCKKVQYDNPRFVRKSTVNFSDLGGEAFLFDQEGYLTYLTNSVAEKILSYLGIPRSIAQIQEFILQAYSGDKEMVKCDLVNFLRELVDKEVVIMGDYS